MGVLPAVRRRHFILASTGAAAAAAEAAPVRRLEAPRFEKVGRTLQVRFAGLLWEIDASRFGESAAVESREVDPINHRVALDRARYPGTDVEASFRASIYNDGAQWRIDIDLKDATSELRAAEIEPPLLEAWMQGRAQLAFSRPARFRIGQVEVASETKRLVVSMDSDLRMSWQARVQVDLKIARLRAMGGSLDARAGSHELIRGAMPAERQPRARTALAFHETTSIGSIALGRVGASHQLAFESQRPRLTMIAFDAGRRRDEALIVVQGHGAFVIRGSGLLRQGGRLPLDKAALTSWASDPRRDLDVAYTLQRKEFLFEADGFSLGIGGKADATLHIERGILPKLAISAELTQAHIPVRGASMASISIPRSDVYLQIAGSTPPRDCAVRVWLAQRALLDLPLDRAALHLQRSIDHFDLRFEFRNYSLQCLAGKTRLFERWAFAAGCEVLPNPPTLIAVFSPQHVQEQVFQSIQDYKELKDLKFPNELARTAISGPSRIAMQSVNPEKGWEDGAELTIEHITDWEHLSLAVHARALPADAPLSEQMSAIHLHHWTSRADARIALLKSLVTSPGPDQTALEPVTGLIVSPDRSAWFSTPRTKPTGAGGAALWSARLRLGENSAVRALHARRSSYAFLADQCLPNTPPKHLHDFTGTLNLQDRAELVVLMSAYAMPSLRRLVAAADGGGQLVDDAKGMVIRPKEKLAFLSDYSRTYPIPGITPPVSVTAYQEGVLVPRGYREFDLTLSALKATLRARWDGEPPAPLDGDKFFGTALTVQGYIHRTMWGRDALVQVAYKGFLFPLGHRAALIKVSERPFKPARMNPDLLDPRAYLIQRHYIVCSKPTKVFPALGQPFNGREFPAASVEMVTLVTPDIMPVDEATAEALHLPIDDKLPEQGIDPTCNSAGRPTARAVGRVFWPRTRPGKPDTNSTPTNRYGHEVSFEYRIDGHPQLLRSALLFVDNAAAHHAATMSAVVQYYAGLHTMVDALVRGESLPGPRATGSEARDALRIATTGGAERRYAPALQGGDTSFQTEYWVLGASGGVRVGQPAKAETPNVIRRWLGSLTTPPDDGAHASFAMDALMEGADQPPFYPRVHRALIKMQSLDRLLGRPQGLIEVGFSNRYVVHALDESANPAEIYLDVVKPNVDLDLSGQGDAAGGVAKPNARLAAIGRKTGMIGGRSVQKAPGAAVTGAVALTTLPAGVPQTELSFDTTSALSGRFDAAEFLGGAVADAKLLGIISLKDVIRVVAIGMAPKLREVAEYAGDTLAEELPKIARLIDGAVSAAVDAGNAAASQMLGDGVPDPLRQFYPALAARTQRLRATCARIAQTPETELKGSFASLAAELYESGKEFVQGLEQVAADPTPQGLADYLKSIREAVKALEALADPVSLRKFVVGKVHAAIDGLLSGLVRHLFGNTDTQPGAFDVAFGITGDTGLIEKRAAVLREVVTHPAGVVDRLRSSAMEQALPGLFVEAYARLDTVRREALGLLAWARSELREEIIGLLAQADPILREVPAVQKLGAEFANEMADALDGFDAADALRKGGLPALLASLHDKARPVVAQLVKQYESAVFQQAKDAADALVAASQPRVNQLRKELEKAVPQAERERLEASLRVAESELAVLRRAANLRQLSSFGKLAEQAVHAEIERQARRLETVARAALEDVLGSISTQVVAAIRPAFEAGGHLIEFVVRAGNTALQTWCTSAAADTLRDLRALLIGPTLPDAIAACRRLLDELMAVKVPSGLPEDRRAEAESLLSDARRQLSEAKAQGETLFALAAQALDNDPCQNPVKSAQIVSIFDRLARSRVRMVDASMAGLAAAARCQIQLLLGNAQGMQLATKSVGALNICARLTELLGQIEALLPSDAAIAKLKARASDIDKLGSVARAGTFARLIDRVADQVKVARRELNGLKGDCANSQEALLSFVAELDQQRAHLVRLLEREERRITGFLLDHLLPKLIPDLVALNAALIQAMSGMAGPIQAIAQLHADVAGATDTLLARIANATETSPLAELITAMAGPGLAALREAQAVVKTDAGHTKAVSDAFAAQNAADALKALDTVRQAWSTQEPGLVRATQLLSRLAQSLMRGQLSALFDFNGVRDKIKEHLLGLLPTRISQTYDFDSRLEDFPANDPVFSINRTASAQEAPLLAQTRNDLVLSTRVEIDLLKNTRKANLHGTIRPFNIRLLGERLDLVTVKFKGAEFSAGTDTQPTYKTELMGVEIGGMLEFIKALQSFFAPKPGNGPYYGVTLFPPQAVAGYRYSAPTIPIGTLFIMNVAIDVSMNLPFDNRQATFRFAFASRDLPFLICAPPYGGGGFVALLANAKGIIGFEIQFEFGAVVPIEFGPLRAQGRVTAGIYLMSSENARVLEGFVCAAGEGNIACFGISVNIAVRVRQHDGGRMEGSSSYSFSFKVGFAEVSYSFSAQYAIQGGDGGNAGGGRRGGGAGASFSPQYAIQGGGGGSGGGGGPGGDKGGRGNRGDRPPIHWPAPELAGQWICTRLPAKQSQWKRYRAHVAI